MLMPSIPFIPWSLRTLKATSSPSIFFKFMAKAIADANTMIVVSHFKGHGSDVYVVSIKNVTIGCSSKRGKLSVHLTTHPEVGWKAWSFEGENCTGLQCPDAQGPGDLRVVSTEVARTKSLMQLEDSVEPAGSTPG
jgi:hypothetical protein